MFTDTLSPPMHPCTGPIQAKFTHSFPRGDIWDTATAMSDITFDVLIETGVSVSPMPFWRDEFDHPEQAKNPALIHNIHREGIRL